jgi:acyl-CoA synthetase (NDP forming)
MNIMMRDNLKKLFCPESIAVIGASNSFDKLGYHVMKSLVGNYQGKIYPVNPKPGEVWGIASYSSLQAIPADVDVAVIVVPATLVSETLHECGRKNVRGVVLITAGFREIEDTQGEVLQKEIKEIANQYQMPIIGPNTFGYVNLTSSINASFTSEFSQIEKGGVAFIAQSGGMCHLCGFLSIEQRVAMSKLMSLGNRCNVDFPELLEYLEDDETTRVIALYIEGLDDPRDLMNAVKAMKRKKPVIAYKSGRTEKGDSASRLHTGSLAGDWQIWKRALRQAGILEVSSSEELLDTAKVLDCCALPKGDRIAVLSGQAGPGMIATDALDPEGLKISEFTPETQAKINSLLPPIAIRNNPVDMGPAWYDPKRMLEILKTAIEDKNTDGVIFLTMYASANLKVAEELVAQMERADSFQKPVITCFNAPPLIWDKAIKGLDRKKGLVILPTPERAAKAMANLYRIYSLNSKSNGLG